MTQETPNHLQNPNDDTANDKIVSKDEKAETKSEKTEAKSEKTEAKSKKTEAKNEKASSEIEKASLEKEIIDVKIDEKIQADIDAEIPDHVGEIATAKCESISSNRVIGRFGRDQLVSVAKGEFAQLPKIGESFDAYIEGLMKNGMWGGSVDKIAPYRLWQCLEKGMREETEFSVVVVAAEPNGIVCDLHSIAAFMPTREIGVTESTAQELIGKTLNARIIKMSPQQGNIIISHKAAIAQSLREARETVLTNLKPGQEYEGIVRQIVDFGAFVDIGAGVEGLVHRSNLSWENDDPAKCVCLGDRIKVVVLSTDKGRIALGHKQLVKDCWATAAETLHVGDIVEGKVTTFTTFGAFVRLDNGIEGLVHNTELSWDDAIRQAKQIIKLGQVVRVSIVEIDPEKRRLRLSLRRVEGDPWQKAVEAYPVGTKVTLPVAGIADFGIFLDMGDHIRGLVHKSDISWNDAPIDLAKRFPIGTPTDAIVLAIDAQRHRASLGIKQLECDPWAEFMARAPLGKQFKATIRRIAKFGAFANIADTPLDGLIHVSELAEHRVERIESIVKLGDEVTVTVVQIDPQKHRIGLSLIAEPFTPTDATPEPTPQVPTVTAPTMADIFPDVLKPPRNV